MTGDKDGWKFPLAFQHHLNLSKDVRYQLSLTEPRENVFCFRAISLLKPGEMIRSLEHSAGNNPKLRGKVPLPGQARVGSNVRLNSLYNLVRKQV